MPRQSITSTSSYTVTLQYVNITLGQPAEPSKRSGSGLEVG